jgi:hypothetical protein
MLVTGRAGHVPCQSSSWLILDVRQKEMSDSRNFLLASGIVMISASAAVTFTARFRYPGRGIGRVVDVVSEDRPRSEGGTHLMFAPIVEFRPEGYSHPIRFQDPIWSVPASHKIGDSVAVAYSLEVPNTARIDSPGRLYLLPIVFGLLGATLIYAAFQK